ncbi:transcriptional regulator [Streptomyces sp. NBC_00287]|uniref:transcriptional regulator n=1 Tax=Streptomyces sp. NBC_00287 TaxID=2975702 RepID=UPI002E2DF105|nr:transcriptional regulator [Streptomyces sp. NBC_00287]
MTALRATPAGPPRLPVRDRSTAGERAPRGLSPMLSRLAAEQATGVLLRERGTLYLAEGRVVHAESPAAPGLDVLLTAHGTLSTAAWRDAVARADDRHGAARLLVDGGRITPGTLELCHLGALYDAAYFALAPSSTPGRFRYGTGHWLGPVHPVPVAAVERETLRRRDLLHRIWPDPGTDQAPLARADPLRTPMLTARQRAVVALLDGVRTATDIARALGRPAFHTLVDIRRLAAAGVLTPRPVEPERTAAVATPLSPPSTPRSEPPNPTPAPPPLPTRPNPPSPAERLAVDDPDVALLKRVRDALEAL